MFGTICILGPGLLGASVMMTAIERGLCERTAAWSRRESTRQKCADQSWCKAVFDTPEEAVKDADLILICTPVETIPPLLEQISSHLKPGAIVSDVGSTKNTICEAGMSHLGSSFIGSHPMAGSHKTGLEHATTELFDGAKCFVTPHAKNDSESVNKLNEFWTAIGMTVLETSPQNHDAIVAHVSHLPHLLASALAVTLSTVESDWLEGSGPGLKDTTRIAAGDPQLWADIFKQNKSELIKALATYRKSLDELEELIAKDDMDHLIQKLETGKSVRNSLDT